LPILSDTIRRLNKAKRLSKKRGTRYLRLITKADDLGLGSKTKAWKKGFHGIIKEHVTLGRIELRLKRAKKPPKDPGKYPLSKDTQAI